MLGSNPVANVYEYFTLRKKIVRYCYINVIRMLRFCETIVWVEKREVSGSLAAGIHMGGKQLHIYFFS